MFAVRRQILEELLKDEGWTRKLEACRNVSDVERVLTEFCKAKGYKIAQIEEAA
jgi:hypothetical protein